MVSLRACDSSVFRDNMDDRNKFGANARSNRSRHFVKSTYEVRQRKEGLSQTADSLIASNSSNRHQKFNEKKGQNHNQQNPQRQIHSHRKPVL